MSERYLTEWYSDWSKGIFNGTNIKLFSIFINGFQNGIPFRIPLSKKLNSFVKVPFRIPLDHSEYHSVKYHSDTLGHNAP